MGSGCSSTVSLVVFSSTSVGHICQVNTLHFFSIFFHTPFTLLNTAAWHPGLNFKQSPWNVCAFTDLLQERLCFAFRFLPQPKAQSFTSEHTYYCASYLLQLAIRVRLHLTCVMSQFEQTGHVVQCEVWVLRCDELLERGTEIITVTPVTQRVIFGSGKEKEKTRNVNDLTNIAQTHAGCLKITGSKRTPTLPVFYSQYHIKCFLDS